MSWIRLFSLTAALIAAGSSLCAQHDVSQLLRTADSLVAQAQFDSALAVELTALSAAEETYGRDDTLVAKVLMYIGAELSGLGRDSEAVERFTRALDIRTAKMGAEHPRVADCHMNLGIALQRLQKYGAAQTHFQAAYRINVRALGPEHPKTVRSAQNIFGFYQHIGLIDSAGVYAELAVKLSRAVYGPDHFETAVNLGNLAVLQLQLQQLDRAENNLEEAIAILDRNTASPALELQQAVFLNNLGNVYADLNKHRQAVDAYQRALDIRETYLGTDHPDYAVTLGNLASTYVALGEWEQAIAMNRRALDSFERFYGPDHNQLAHVLVNLGIACHKLGREEEAGGYYQRALSIRTGAFGRQHPAVATVLYNLAVLNASEGKLGTARSFQEEALTIRQSLFGPRNPAVAECLEHLSYLDRQSQHYEDALTDALNAEAIRRHHLAQTSVALSEREALAFSIAHRQSLGTLVACHFEAPPEVQSRFLTRVADALLSSKGMITDQMAHVYRWTLHADDSATVRLVTQLRKTREQLADLYVAGPSLGSDDFRQQVDSLQRAMEEDESNLVRTSKRHQTERQQMNVTVAEIASLIPENACLIEYYRLDLPVSHDPDERTREYLALLVQKDSEPVLKHLGDAVTVDTLIGELHEHMQKIARTGSPDEEDRATYLAVTRPLTDIILTPLTPYIPDDALVLISSDGPLSTVSFASLPLHESTYLIEQHAVHYISAGRDLLRFNKTRTTGHGLLAIGDPDFNTAARQLVTAGGTPAVRGAESKRSSRDFPDDCGALRDLLASPLPSTADEIRAVTTFWNAHGSSKPLVLTGPDATEQNFKHYAPEKRAIHIATHGFFVGESCDAAAFRHETSRRLMIGSDNPLLFSGLLLAGANKRLFEEASADSPEDGLLTALEVSTLDLTGTSLVVLSACETGLGTVEDGEGLFGLKRAFHLAGASTVVSTLWSVPDETTAALLGSLYDSRSVGLPQRLRSLQTEALQQMRQTGSVDHPYSWGAITIQGDWQER